MKLPVIEALRLKVIGRSVSPIMPPMVFIDDVANAPEMGAIDHDLEYRASAEFYFTQTGPSGAEDMIREQAVRAIAHGVYGPVKRELTELMHELWSAGVPRQLPAMQRLEILLSEMGGSTNEEAD